MVRDGQVPREVPVQLIPRGVAPGLRRESPDTCAFVVEKVEQPVLGDRSANASAELVVSQLRLRASGDGIFFREEVPGVQHVVPEELVSGAVDFVCAGLDGDVDLSGAAAELGAVVLVHEPKFLDRVDGRRDRRRLKARIVVLDAIDHVGVVGAATSPDEGPAP